MYSNEDMLLDIRLNTLNEFVSNFIICEAKFNHNGSEKKLNFDLNKFKKFKNKIIYLVLEEQPSSLFKIKNNDEISIKKNKILDNALMRENLQRNFCMNTLDKFSENDLVLINDLDEIPNLEKFYYKNKITIFKQKMIYYKFNLEFPNYNWMGSKICKIKHLVNPQWLRNIKSKKYPLWRMDILFSKIKFHDIGFINDGGWHFTNIMSPEDMDLKFRKFLHHLEYEESGYNVEKLKNLIINKRVLYNHSADKKDVNKWQEGKKLEKLDLKSLPDYISKNYLNYKLWLD